MERVPLDVFVKFMFAADIDRVDVARKYKDHRYDHVCDFFMDLRTAIVDTFQRGASDAALDTFLARLTDERKRRIFPACVEGCRRWLRGSPKSWQEPPHTVLPVGDLEIDIRPDLAMTMDGRGHIIVVHYEHAPLSARRIAVTLGLVHLAFGPTRPGWTFGVLHMPLGKLHVMKSPPHPRLGLAVRGDAAAFLTIYDAA